MFRSIWWQFSQFEFHNFVRQLFLCCRPLAGSGPRNKYPQRILSHIFGDKHSNYYRKIYNVVNYFHVPVFVDAYSVYFAVITC